MIDFLLDQEERSRSVEAFRQGRKDVLVATDVASKGLDFQDIQHVINYDMPDDVENYGMKKFQFSHLFLEVSVLVMRSNFCVFRVSSQNRTNRPFRKNWYCYDFYQ